MGQQLSLSARPRTLDQLIGQDKTVARIRGHIASGRIPKAWVFSGPTGTGKTTLARILALSLQCRHQTVFGKPCKECRNNKSSFDITEINAAKITGIREIEEQLEGSYYAPRYGPYRVYTIDEVHASSKQAQSLILKYIEDDTPDTTIFILCSTEPHLIKTTVQGRCLSYKLRELMADDILKLVEKLLVRVGSDLPGDRLADVLVERGISYPRHIAQAVEKYLAGADPEEAAEVEASTVIDVTAVSSSLIKGDWEGVAGYLLKAQTTDVRQIRLSCLAYLRVILLQSSDISERTNIVADAITELCRLSNMEDLAVGAGLAAVLYRCAAFFSNYKH